MVPKGGSCICFLKSDQVLKIGWRGGAWDRGIDGVYPLISRTSGNLRLWGGGGGTQVPHCQTNVQSGSKIKGWSVPFGGTEGGRSTSN